MRGYARWYAMDLLCAIKELRMINVQVDNAYEAQGAKNKYRQQMQFERKKDDITCSYSEDEFFFIAGYTSGGVPAA